MASTNTEVEFYGARCAVTTLKSVRGKTALKRGASLKSPDDVVAFLKSTRLAEKATEEFWSIGLDTKHRPLYMHHVATGTLNASLVHPREVFGAHLRLIASKAIEEAAAAIILVHNHPSGDSVPSKEDIEVTERLVDVGQLIGITVLDHIIVGETTRSLKAHKPYLFK